MMSGRRVVITGMGSVNAAGAGGTAVVAEALERRLRTIAPLKAFDVDRCTRRLAAEVDEARFMALLDPDSVRRLSRICRMALAACRLAVDEAGLEGGERLGLVVGSEYGDFRSGAEFFDGFLRRGPAGLSPMVFPSTVMNSMAAVSAISLGAKATSVTLNQATVAGDLAVARAAALIADGRAEAVVAGGVDDLFSDVYLNLARLGVLSPMGGGAPEGCRPYAPDHNGPVLGEGATFLVLNPGVTVATFQWNGDEVFTSAETDRQGAYKLPRLLERGQCYTMIMGAQNYWAYSEDDVCINAQSPDLVDLPVQLERN